jgi:ABC-type nitrate/sulfonate/bicarbonate transport system substrate-binding protein
MIRPKAAALCALLLAPAALSAADAAPKPAVRNISFRLHWFPGGEHSYLYYGQELGLFEKAGFKLDIRGGKGSSLAVKLIGNGNEDAGLVSADYVLLGLAQGLETRSILTVYHTTPVSIYSLAGKGIKTMKDLYGKKVGVMLESNTWPQYKGMCLLEGVDRTKIRELPVAGEAALGMLTRGELDAHVHYTINGPTILRRKGVKVNEILAAEHGIDMYGMTVVVGPALAKDKEAVKRLRAAVIESLERTRANPKAALEAMQKTVKLEDPDTELARLELLLSWAFDAKTKKLGVGYQTPDGWKTTAETLRKIGQLEDPSLYKRAYWQD